MRSSVENLYRNANYSYQEVGILLAYSFVIGFMFSFDKWGVNGVYNRAIGMQNLILYVIAAILVVFLFTFIQKSVGVFSGIRTTHHVSWTYLFVSVLLCFVTRGHVILFIPPTTHIHAQEHLMIGRKPFGMSVKNLRAFGVMPIILLMLIVVAINQLLPVSAVVASALYWTAFLTCLYSLIPIEFIVNAYLIRAREKAESVLSEHVTHKVETTGVSLGSLLFYSSRGMIVFCLVFLIASMISLVTTGFFFVAIFAVVVAFLVAMIFFVKTELHGH